MIRENKELQKHIKKLSEKIQKLEAKNETLRERFKESTHELEVIRE